VGFSFSGRRGSRFLLLAVALVAVALASAAPARGSEGTAAGSQDLQERAGVAWGEVGAKAMDAVVLRPLGAAASVGGLAFFLVSSPLVALSGRLGTSWDVFVLAPVDYTFQRPLGAF
jgi:hypothetical protein